MSPRNGLLLVQFCALLALSASAALLVDDLGVNPAYCQAVSGCVVARNAAHRWLGPLPMPLVGLIGFAVLLGLTLAIERRWVHRTLLATAIIGGIGGTVLLVLQAFVLKSFCPWCVFVDLLGVAISVQTGILGRQLPKAQATNPHLRPLAVLVFAGMAVTVPFLWPHFRPAAPVPKALAPFQSPTETTLVEFVDLQCPHCKALYPTLEQLRREVQPKFRIYRLHVPSSRHQTARQAARLIQCAPSVEQAERLEQALFETLTLNEGVLRKAARAANMTERAIEQCWSDPRSLRAVERNIALFQQLGSFGLPTTFVGGERITGALPAMVYRSAIARVRRDPASVNGQAAAFWGLIVLLFLSIYVVGHSPAARDEA